MTTSPDTSDSRFRSLVGVGIFLLVIVGGMFAYQHFTSTYHLETVQEGVLYRTGIRSSAEMKRTIDRVKPKTVVCLLDDHELADPAKPQFKEEMEFLKQRGITIERIRVKLGGFPTSENIQRFLTIVAKKENQPVLIHCAQGVRRTGMMVAAFQESILGYDKQMARDKIVNFGHSENTISDIRGFIDVYDSAKRTVPAELSQKHGKE